MTNPLSMDLRVRAMARLAAGESVRSVAAALSVAPSSVVKWSLRLRRTGSVVPGKLGGHVPPKIRDEHRDWLIARIATAFTLRGLVAELAERGLRVGYKTMWTFVHRHGLSFKKNRAGQRAGSSRRRAQTHSVEGTAGEPRSAAAGVHRRDLDQDQYGALARLVPARRTLARSGAPRTLEDHDLPGRAAL